VKGRITDAIVRDRSLLLHESLEVSIKKKCVCELCELDPRAPVLYPGPSLGYYLARIFFGSQLPGITIVDVVERAIFPGIWAKSAHIIFPTYSALLPTASDTIRSPIRLVAISVHRYLIILVVKLSTSGVIWCS
jgi:hypothetical protein